MPSPRSCCPSQQPLDITREKPFVLLVVGVNGSGKTTTIGKLARRFTESGKQVVLAAGDTFRAAAIEQLGVWATRSGADIIQQQAGADPGAVVFDAVTGGALPPRGRGHHRHRRPAAQPVASHGRAEEGQARDPARRTFRAARGPAGSRCQPGTERAHAGHAVPRGGGRDRPGAHQARRHRQGRHRDRHRAQAGIAHPLHRRG